MATDFEDVLHVDGAVNIGGIKEIFYYAPASYFTVPPVLPANPVALGDEVEITVAPTLAVGKFWKKFYSTQETSEIIDKLVGEVDGKSWESEFEFFHPGTKKQAMAWAAKASNTNMIFAVPQADGTNRLVGVEFNAKVDTAEIKTGKKTADLKGMTIKVKTRGTTPAPHYTGVITLS